METARVHKPAEPAPAPQAKKTPFFPAAAVQPKMTVHKLESKSPETATQAQVSTPVIKSMPFMPVLKPQAAPKQENTFFKPVIAPTAIIRNLHEPRPDQPQTEQAVVKAGQPSSTSKPEATIRPLASVGPVAGAAEKITGAVDAAASHADPAAMVHPEADNTEPSVAAKGNSDAPITSSIASSAEAVPAKGTAPHEASKPATAASHAQKGSPQDDAGAVAGTAFKHMNPAKTDAIFRAKLHKAATLAKKTAKTKSASEKIEESKAAQDSPAEENQSSSNRGQVGHFDNGRKDPKTADQAKNKRDTAITANMPRTMDDIDEFKDSGKGQVISQAITSQVTSDVSEVKARYEGMNQTPPPAPAEKGTPLPAPEQAEQMAQINMGAGVVPQIDKQELDTKQYTDQSDATLKNEGLTQEHLDLVDSGDLATANKGRKQLQQDVVSQPAEVQQMAVQEHKKVETEMKVQEMHSRADMHGHRDQHLSKTTERQRKAKEELEARRAGVAREINKRFTACQNSIMTKLDALEKKSLLQFDLGQANATDEFTDEVNTNMAKFKHERYKGVRGKLRRGADIFRSIDELPPVKKIFEDARKNFVDRIDRLLGIITQAANEVITGCQNELKDCKEGIKTYVDGLEPQLKDAAKKAEDDVNKQLDDLNAKIDERKQKLQQALADKRKAAIANIDKKIEAMKEKLKGALAKLGALLLKAAIKFFKWALESVGLSPDSIMGVIDKGVSIIKAIVTSPGTFVGNLVKAAKAGFTNFKIHFVEHLKDSVFKWLTGAMQGVRLPKTWDPKGILLFILDILGLTYEKAIKPRLLPLIGEKGIQVLEATVPVIQTLIKDGPGAAWEQIKDMAGEMMGVFIDAVTNWIRDTIIFRAVEAIVKIFIPGAGFVQAIVSIYDTIMFFIQKARQIIQMIGSFLDSIGDIVAGRIDGAAGALETGLSSALTLVISFLASFLHLDGITDKIKMVIEAIQTKVSMVIDKIITWIKGMAKNLFGKKEKEPDDPEKQKKIDVAAGDLQMEEQKYLVSGKISLEDSKKVAATIKRKHSVFKTFEVIDDGETWDYSYTASARATLPGAKKADKGEGFKSTKPDYGNPTSPAGFGSRATAKILTKEPFAGGSEADSSWTTDVYTILNKRRRSKASVYPYYKRGHLLSWRFGGPGNEGFNLTPLSSRGNAQHRVQVEAKVQAGLEQKNQKGRYAAFTYVIKPIYGRSDVVSIDKFNFTSAEKKRKNTIEKILAAEKAYVPIAMECSVKEKKQGDEPLITNIDIYQSVLNDIQSSPENYYVRDEDLID